MSSSKMLWRFTDISASRLLQKSLVRVVCVRGCSGESSGKTTTATVDDGKYEESVKTKILGAALEQVPKHGWSLTSMECGAESVGYPATVHGLFPRREAHLVDFFTRECNGKLVPFLEHLPGGDPLHFVELALQERLRMLEPYTDSWPQALAIGARPANVPHSLAGLLALVDDICWHAGDRSVDLGWYTRRVALALIYKSTELYLVQDTSNDRHNTWQFLARQLRDARLLQDRQLAAQNAADLSVECISSAFTTARNILGLQLNR